MKVPSPRLRSRSACPCLPEARCVCSCRCVASARALHAQDDVYDLVIRNGRIIDGTGSPWYAGDLGIRGGRIAAIGRLDGAAARQTVDAAGMVVAPGFIDMLGQSELTHPGQPGLPSKIFQGITTEITGEGGSAGPLNDSIIAADRRTTSTTG